MEKNILIALVGTIMIPIVVAVENWIFRSRRDKKDINKIIYADKFNYDYNQLFNHIIENNNNDVKINEIDLGKMNIELIRNFIKTINDFNELNNSFKGRGVQNKFSKLSKIARKISEKEKEHKWFKYTNIENIEGSKNFYDDFNKELFTFKIEFVIFYKIIFETI